ncbi:MAG: hypothetical protein P8J20_13720 [Novosphingobium sp.]|nr:hypothetical protein [Novosphingobium sp.]
MRRTALASLGSVTFLALLAAAPALADRPANIVGPIQVDVPTVNLRQDSETMIGGLSVACTGIAGSKEDPRWPSYPLRLEFANDLREHLIGAQVKLWDDDHQIMNVTCWAPWLLLKPPGGKSYRVEATIIGESAPAQCMTVKSPTSGQTRIVLEFPGVDA